MLPSTIQAHVIIAYSSLQTGRVDTNQAKVAGHRSRVLDIKWNPFDENLIASASEDCTIKVILQTVVEMQQQQQVLHYHQCYSIGAIHATQEVKLR